MGVTQGLTPDGGRNLVGLEEGPHLPLLDLALGGEDDDLLVVHSFQGITVGTDSC